MSDIKLLQNELDGKLIAYSNVTEFYIQISKSRNAKSSYRTRRIITGSLGQAVMHYNMLNIGNGYKKRIIMCGKVLAKQLS